MKCWKCGFEIPDNSVICRNCGESRWTGTGRVHYAYVDPGREEQTNIKGKAKEKEKERLNRFLTFFLTLSFTSGFFTASFSGKGEKRKQLRQQGIEVKKGVIKMKKLSGKMRLVIGCSVFWFLFVFVFLFKEDNWYFGSHNLPELIVFGLIPLVIIWIIPSVASLQPPRLRINPPPVNSFLRPCVTPFLT